MSTGSNGDISAGVKDLKRIVEGTYSGQVLAKQIETLWPNKISEKKDKDPDYTLDVLLSSLATWVSSPILAATAWSMFGEAAIRGAAKALSGNKNGDGQ